MASFNRTPLIRTSQRHRPITWQDAYEATTTEWKLQEQIRRELLEKKGVDPDAKGIWNWLRRSYMGGALDRGAMYATFHFLEKKGLVDMRKVYIPRNEIYELCRNKGYSIYRARAEAPTHFIYEPDKPSCDQFFEVRRASARIELPSLEAVLAFGQPQGLNS